MRGGEIFFCPDPLFGLAYSPLVPDNTRNRLPIRAAILWGLGAFAFALLFTTAVFRNIPPASDLWDYSQEARQLARGQGFTSLYTYPTHLGSDEEPPFPVRWRQPLYAARGAMVLNMRGWWRSSSCWARTSRRRAPAPSRRRPRSHARSSSMPSTRE
jgi:hypothetical protein